MIIRQWRGLAKLSSGDHYLAHFRADVLPKLQALAGFCGATVMRRTTRHGVEVIVLTRWESLDAVRQFAGDDLEAAVVAPVAQAYLASYCHSVSHHEIVLDEPA